MEDNQDVQSLQATKKAIPKFASFRPQAALAPGRQSQLVPSEAQRRRNHTKESPHDDRRDQKRRHDRREVSHHRRNRSGSEDPPVHASTAFILSERTSTWDVKAPSFVIDRDGDPENARYGSIHRYAIPAYFRQGAGAIVGLPKWYRIHRDGVFDKDLLVADRSTNHASSREKYVLSHNGSKRLRHLRIRQVEPAVASSDARLDFIPLSAGRDSTKLSDGSDQSESGDDVVDYRSIKGEAKARDVPADEDLEFLSNSSASDSEAVHSNTLGESEATHGIELSRRVEANATDVRAWMDLINYQSTLLDIRSAHSGRRITTAQIQSTADIKLSMYEKALVGLGAKNAGRETLLLGMMEEGAKVWERGKQLMKWKSILHDAEDSFLLWIRYLDFVETTLLVIDYEKTRTEVFECLQLLKAISRRLPRESIYVHNRLARTFTYVVLRCTIFMREAGYREHAIAVWQGLFELNLCADAAKFDVDHRLHDDAIGLEVFWDSEVPRIGEEGARGWGHHRSLDEAKPVAMPKMDPKIPEPDREDSGTAWVNAEESIAQVAREPARTVDETAEDDPDRVILYNDLADLMAYLPSSATNSTLLNAFLAYCGLPVLIDDAEDKAAEAMMTVDPFVRHEAIFESDEALARQVKPSRSRARDEISALTEGLHVSLDKETCFSHRQQNWVAWSPTLFPRECKWFSSFFTWMERYPNDCGPLPLTWLHRILQTLADRGAGGAAFAEYYLAFLLKNSTRDPRKKAKALLKKHPTSLRLYNAYALLEWRAGECSAAEKVFSTALSMSRTFSNADQQATIILWHSWIWELLLDGSFTSAWYKLLSIPHGQPLALTQATDLPDAIAAHPSALLNVQRHLQDNIAHLTSLNSNYSNSTLPYYTSLLSLLAYLSPTSFPSSTTVSTSTPNIFLVPAALSIYTSTLCSLSKHPPDTPFLAHTTQLIHQSLAHMIHYHQTELPRLLSPPSSTLTLPSLFLQLCTTTLLSSVTAFPSNTLLLATLALHHTPHFPLLASPLHRILNIHVLTPDHATVCTWSFAIWWTIHTNAPSSHAVRSMFERAIAPNAVGGRSAALWLWYLTWLLHTAGINREKVRVVWERAIGTGVGAGCKRLWLWGVKHLGMETGEMERVVVKGMGQEGVGLRVHVDMGEWLEKVQHAAMGSD